MNGINALEHLKKEHFDLVLMDIEMPEMDGCEATQRIREDKSGAFDPNIPIFALSAHMELRFKGNTLQNLVNDIIIKPVDLYKLSRLISTIRTGKNQAFPAAATREECKKENENEKDAKEMLTLDHETAIGRLAGNKKQYARFCRMFLDEIPDIAAKLDWSLSQKDFEELRKQAHYLKGSGSMIGADMVAHYSTLLEKEAGQTANFREARRLLYQLKIELSKLKEPLFKIINMN